MSLIEKAKEENVSNQHLEEIREDNVSNQKQQQVEWNYEYSLLSLFPTYWPPIEIIKG